MLFILLGKLPSPSKRGWRMEARPEENGPENDDDNYTLGDNAANAANAENALVSLLLSLSLRVLL